MSVDLPAPFSPTRAWTWPRSSVRSTPASAATAPNVLVMPLIRSSGSLMGGPSVGLVQELAGVAGVEQAVLEEDAGRHLFPRQVLLEGVEGEGAEAGVGLDGGAQLAAEDRLQRR